MTKKYVRDKIIQTVVEMLETDDFFVFNTPHSRNFSDIFGMWDSIVYDRKNKCIVFIQYTLQSKLKDCIKRHKLNDASRYIVRDGIIHLVCSYKKSKGRYKIEVYRVDVVLTEKKLENSSFGKFEYTVVFNKIYGGE